MKKFWSVALAAGLMVGLSSCAEVSDGIQAFKESVKEHLDVSSLEVALADAQSFCDFMTDHQKTIADDLKQESLKIAVESARDEESLAIFTYAIDYLCPELRG